MPTTEFRPLSPSQVLKVLAEKLLLTKDQIEALGEYAYLIAWTVAYVTELRVLEALRESLLVIIREGGTLDDWRDALDDIWDQYGWGTSDWHAETIMRTTLAQVYEAERFEMLMEDPAVEYLMYSAINDDRVREEHLALDGMTWKREEFPTQIWPPNGYNCRCTVIPVSADNLAQLGAKLQQAGPPIVNGQRWQPDPGFSSPPTLSGLQGAAMEQLRQAATRMGISVPPPERGGVGG